MLVHLSVARTTELPYFTVPTVHYSMADYTQTIPYSTAESRIASVEATFYSVRTWEQSCVYGTYGELAK